MGRLPIVTFLAALAALPSLATHVAAPSTDAARQPVTGETKHSAALNEPALAGVVRDATGDPVINAFVFVCSAETGVPIGATTKRSFLAYDEQGERPDWQNWLAARTDEHGRFSVEDLPAGEYRLVAQSWPEAKLIESVHDVNGLIVTLRGATDAITVPSEEAREIAITPLGDGTFVYNRGASNDDWYLVLSTEAPVADPALGWIGWRGRFLQNAIGWGRMIDGNIIVRGLPNSYVHYTLFASDSRPGFGAGSFRGWTGDIVAHDTNVVVGWSDGIHDPSETLAPLCARLRELAADQPAQAFVMQLLLKGREDKMDVVQSVRGYDSMFVAVDALGPLEREIQLPDGAKATVGDLMAAMAYIGLQDMYADD